MKLVPQPRVAPRPRRKPRLATPELLAGRLRHQEGPWGFLLDHDGTLTRFRIDPARALPSRRALTVLRRLLRRGRPVAIASGRPLSFLRAAYPIPGLDLVGSHGSEILASGGAGRSFGDRSAVVAEARPGGTAKGDVLRFLRRTSPAWRWRAVLAIGDDATDEDMFATLRPGDVGVLVARRPRASHARWRLPSTGHVVRFLEAVAAAGKEEKCR